MESIAISGVLPASVLIAVPAALHLARSARPSGPESLALAAGLVLAWCMGGGMLLGGLGWLTAPAVWTWLAAGVALAGWAGRREFSRRRWNDWKASWRGEGAAALLLPPGLWLLALASPPPWYRDSLVYHLALPRLFAHHGGYTWPDDNVFAAFPLGWESALSLLYALGAGPDPEPAFNPRLAGAWTLLAAGLATYALARAVGARPALSAAGAGLLLLLPSAAEFGASAYVENALLLGACLSLWWTLRARDGQLPWWGSAVAAGLTAWLKYPALALLVFLAAAAPALECVRRGRREPRQWLGLALRWGSLAALVASPFYLRNWLWRGNPVFPTGYALFGGEGWDAWRAWAYRETLANYGHGREPLDLLLLPWRLFTQRSFDGGFEGSLGPLLGLALPLAAWTLWRGTGDARLRRHGPWLLAWSLWIALFWTATVQQARFYLIAAPAALALGGAALSSLPALTGATRRRVAAAGLVAAQLAWSAAPLAELWRRQATGDWLAGRLDRDRFLARMLPETWPVWRDLPASVPPDGRVWLVWMRGYTYYLTRPYRLDSVFEAWRLEALLDEHAEPAALGAALERDGISHLLVNHRFFLVGGNADLRPGRTRQLEERFRRALGAGVLEPLERWGSVSLYGVTSTAAPDLGRSARR